MSFDDLFPSLPVEIACGRDDIDAPPVAPDGPIGADDDWPRARPYQEDGHLAVDAWERKRPS